MQCFSITPRLRSLRQVHSVNLEPGWQPACTSNAPVSTHTRAGALGVYSGAWLFTWVLKISECVLFPTGISLCAHEDLNLGNFYFWIQGLAT